MSEDNLTYILDVSNPRELAQKQAVQKEISFGSSRDCDLIITGLGLSPLEGKFRFQNEILTYIQMTDGDQIKIGNQTCKKGRMYILEKGDRISTEKGKKDDKLKIVIRYEEFLDNSSSGEELEEDDQYDEVEYDNDPTDPAVSPKTSAGVFDLKEVTGIFKNPNTKNPKELIISFFDSLKERYHDIIDYFRDFTLRKNSKKTPEEIMKDKLDPLKRGSKNKKRGGEISPAAGILPRFLGMFYNLVFFAVFYFQLLPLLESSLGINFSVISADLHKDLTPLLNKIPSKIEAVAQSEMILAPIKEYISSVDHFNFIFLFLSYEILANLLLGVGVGQFILGLRAKGKFLLVRLLSPLRLLIYIFTAPFLIFDAPIIMNKRSLKEKLTLTSIESKSMRSIFLNALITFPLIIILACNFELGLNLISGNPPLAKEIINIGRSVTKTKNDKISFKVNQKDFGLNSNILLKLDEIIIPSVYSENSKYFLKLIFYSPKSEGSIEVTQSKLIIPSQEIFTTLKQDPNNIEEFKIADPKQPEKYVLTSETDQTVLEKLYEVLTFDISDPLPSIEKMGLITNPYQKTITKTLKSLGMNQADKSALFLGPNDTFLTLERSRTDYQISLLNLTSEGFTETRFSFAPKLRKRAIELIKDLWVPANPHYKASPTIELISKLAEGQNPNIILGAFTSLDGLNKILNSKELGELDLPNLTNTFLQLSYQSLKTEDQVLNSLLNEELQKLDKWLLVYDKKNTKQSLSEFRLNLLRIQKALSEKDETFFEMNK